MKLSKWFFDYLPFAFVGGLVLFVAGLIYCAIHTECVAWGPAWVNDYITTYIPMPNSDGSTYMLPVQTYVGQHLDPHACLNYEWKE